MNLLGDNIDTTKKNTGSLIDAFKEDNLEVNAENTKYVSIYYHQNAGQNHNIKTANKSFENLEQFKYFGVTVTNENMIQ
jgi:hypothetical protein